MADYTAFDLGDFSGDASTVSANRLSITGTPKVCPFLDMKSMSFCRLDGKMCPFVGFDFIDCQKFQKARGKLNIPSAINPYDQEQVSRAQEAIQEAIQQYCGLDESIEDQVDALIRQNEHERKKRVTGRRARKTAAATTKRNFGGSSKGAEEKVRRTLGDAERDIPSDVGGEIQPDITGPSKKREGGKKAREPEEKPKISWYGKWEKATPPPADVGYSNEPEPEKKRKKKRGGGTRRSTTKDRMSREDFKIIFDSFEPEFQRHARSKFGSALSIALRGSDDYQRRALSKALYKEHRTWVEIRQEETLRKLGGNAWRNKVARGEVPRDVATKWDRLDGRASGILSKYLNQVFDVITEQEVQYIKRNGVDIPVDTYRLKYPTFTSEDIRIGSAWEALGYRVMATFSQYGKAVGGLKVLGIALRYVLLPFILASGTRLSPGEVRNIVRSIPLEPVLIGIYMMARPVIPKLKMGKDEKSYMAYERQRRNVDATKTDYTGVPKNVAVSQSRQYAAPTRKRFLRASQPGAKASTSRSWKRKTYLR